MKVSHLFVLLFVFAAFVFVDGQVKPKPQPPKNDSQKLLLLIQQKIELEEKLESLLIRYSPEYPEAAKLKKSLDETNKSISKLIISEPPASSAPILQADLSQNDLLKTIIVQNQHIIELLEKLINKK